MENWDHVCNKFIVSVVHKLLSTNWGWTWLQLIPISGAAYLVSPVFDDVDDELEELFACDDDSDSADSDDFPVSRENVSNLLLSLSNQVHACKRVSPCGARNEKCTM